MPCLSPCRVIAEAAVVTAVVVAAKEHFFFWPWAIGERARMCYNRWCGRVVCEIIISSPPLLPPFPREDEASIASLRPPLPPVTVEEGLGRRREMGELTVSSSPFLLQR